MENTIASLKDAASHGADMVEFDVQVSKDLVPVIYHNFDLVVTSEAKGQDKVKMTVPLRSLTLEQLHNLKVQHVEELSHGPKEFSDLEDHEPFPTLQKALETIDVHTGFNVELKWDMELKDGSREIGQGHGATELNLYADTVIQTILKHAGGRKILFSSFNPDVCTV